MSELLDLDDLKAKALAATPGSWEFHADDGSALDADVVIAFPWGNGREVTVASWASASDSDHIAAFDPPTVLALIERVERAEAQSDVPSPCAMTHTPPFDFAQCETHDETFPLGAVCKWHGKESIAAVLEDEADAQRARAVMAEERAEQAEARITAALAPHWKKTFQGREYCGPCSDKHWPIEGPKEDDLALPDRRRPDRREREHPVMLDPDCRDGKHQACTRMAWNEEKDEPADCECACHDMDDLTLMQLH